MSPDPSTGESKNASDLPRSSPRPLGHGRCKDSCARYGSTQNSAAEGKGDFDWGPLPEDPEGEKTKEEKVRNLANAILTDYAPRGNAVLYDRAREDALVALLKKEEGDDLEVGDDELDKL